MSRSPGPPPQGVPLPRTVTPLSDVLTEAAKKRDQDARYVAAIVAARRAGEPLRAIAEAAGCSPQTIDNIVRREGK